MPIPKYNLLRDPSDFRLSDSQREVFSRWSRPDQILPPRSAKIASQQTATVGPTMVSHEQIDLVQDLTSDCSVVASLCSMIAREDKGHIKVSFSTAL